MDQVSLLPLVARWVHILSAIAALGGSIFIYFVLNPVVQLSFPEPDRERLRANLMRRWRIVLHTAILLFLLSGFYNYLAITRLQHQGQAIYHALFGIKFLLALALFFVAIALSGKSAMAERFRANYRRWTGVVVSLGVAIVLISGLLRALPQTVPASTQTIVGNGTR